MSSELLQVIKFHKYMSIYHLLIIAEISKIIVVIEDPIGKSNA